MQSSKFVVNLNIFFSVLRIIEYIMEKIFISQLIILINFFFSVPVLLHNYFRCLFCISLSKNRYVVYQYMNSITFYFHQTKRDGITSLHGIHEYLFVNNLSVELVYLCVYHMFLKWYVNFCMYNSDPVYQIPICLQFMNNLHLLSLQQFCAFSAYISNDI